MAASWAKDRFYRSWRSSGSAGGVFVEATVLLTLFLMLFVITAQGVIMIYNAYSLTAAVREGARYASMLAIDPTNSSEGFFLSGTQDGSEGDLSGIRAVVLNSLNLIGDADGIAISWDATFTESTGIIQNTENDACGHTVTVSAELPQNFAMLRALGFNLDVLRASTTVRYGRQTLCS